MATYGSEAYGTRTTNIEGTPYVPVDDGTGQYEVCAAIPGSRAGGGLHCRCIKADPDIHAGMEQYLPSECRTNCAGSSPYMVHVSSNSCISAPNSMASDGAVFCNLKDCLFYVQSTSLG